MNFLLGPGVNIARSPVGGRNFEYLWEDPYLNLRTPIARSTFEMQLSVAQVGDEDGRGRAARFHGHGYQVAGSCANRAKLLG